MNFLCKRRLKMLYAEHWLMILTVFLFLLAARCPTRWSVEFKEPEEDLVTCLPRAGRCDIFKPSKSSALVSRVVDKALMADLDRKFYPYLNRTGFALIQTSTCESPFKTAIIVPYRNRPYQLKLFLQHMHTFLPQQNIDYSIYIMEQSEQYDFNRGTLMNIGFKEALRDANYCCFIFHDVDLLPLNLKNLYACSTQPRHVSVSIDTFRYVIPYADIFGGVVAMQKTHFIKVNGFSNRYFGWGGEDDDLFQRLRLANLSATRWSPQISRYSMLVHEKAVPNPERLNTLAETKENWLEDGLSNLRYNVLSRQRTPLYTKVTLDLNL